MDDVEDELDRLYSKLDSATERLTGELVDRQIKILRLKVELIGRRDLIAQLNAAMESNRELASRLAGSAGGTTVKRSDSAPPFILADEGGTN